MSERRGSRSGRDQAARYEVRVNGHLDQRWVTRFDGLQVTHEADGQTVIHGLVADQSALHGVLQRLRDGGVPLLSVTRMQAGQQDLPDERND